MRERRVGAYVVVLQIACWPPPAQADVPTTSAPVGAASLYAEAREAVEAGRHDHAASLLESAVRLEPEHVQYRALLARTYARLGANDRAAAEYVRLGDWYTDRGRHALAAEAFEQAEGLHRRDPQLHVRLARAYYELKQFLGTISIRRVPGASPGRIVGEYYLLGPVPNRPDTYYGCPPSSAIYRIQQAIDGGLEDAATRLLHGDIWLAAGRHAEALAVYRSIENHVPAKEQAGYYFRSARAALGVDATDEYFARLQRAIELDPQRYGPALADAYDAMARRCSRQGELATYIQYLERGADAAPASAELRYRLGNAYWEASRRTDAARQWQIALELQPDHPDRKRMLDLIGAVGSVSSESR
ncbi:MAG: tetratricopeptide repeat protein [Phycisphaerales bacterium]|nr:MAG: tetratricopeptide repeat protein [Phycisphaerales bacterium]